MIREIRTGRDESILEAASTDGLGRLSFYHPVGTFALTPASHILMNAIIQNKALLSGNGIDWGSGVGCLAILAAKISAVDRVYGLEISQANVEAARINAERNGVCHKVSFMLADSYCPLNEAEKQALDELRGTFNFIISNPPSSDWDDGFGFRRLVMTGAKDFLKKDGLVLLNVSFQYGAKRVESLYQNTRDFVYEGTAASTDWVPFDLTRADLLNCLKVYAQEEAAGGTDYTFSDNGSDSRFINARTALDTYIKSGVSPLTKWQTQLFRYCG